MICKKRTCAREIPDDALFCPYCGRKQQTAGSGIVKARKRGNATGSVYQRGNSWVAVQRVYAHRRVVSTKTKCGFKSRSDAERYLMQCIAGAPVGVQQGAMRVLDAWEALQATPKYQELSKSKLTHYRTAWSRLSSIQGRTIGDVPFLELQALVDSAPGDFYAKRDVKALLGKLWDIAVKNESLDKGKDKTGELELPPVPGSTRDAFTLDEVHEMWRAYQDGAPAACYALIMCYTGMRHGELLAMNPANVDLSRQRMVGGIKTAAGKNREIPIAVDIVPVVADALAVARFGLLADSEVVFYRQWHELMEAYNIRSHMTPHSGRHTLATALESAQVSPIVRKLVLGHALRDVTDTYTHIRFPDKLAAVERATAVFKPDGCRRLVAD